MAGVAMATDSRVIYTLSFDFAPFVEAARHASEMMEQLSQMAQRAAESATRLREAFAPFLREMEIKRTHGHGNLDDQGLWQSDMCAGWLHDSCPREARSYCDCTCHGGPLR